MHESSEKEGFGQQVWFLVLFLVLGHGLLCSAWVCYPFWGALVLCFDVVVECVVLLSSPLSLFSALTTLRAGQWF